MTERIIFRNGLIQMFALLFQPYVIKMKSTNHCIDPKEHPYHLEDSVWTHTMMVMQQVLNLNVKFETYRKLQIVALLHDIGKVNAFRIDNNKYYFKGHEGLSTQIAFDILIKMRQCNILSDLNDQDMKEILSVISLHNVKYDDLKYSELHSNFIKCDRLGSISVNIQDEIEYPNRKYIVSNTKGNRELIIIHGKPYSGKTYYSKQFTDHHVIDYNQELSNFYDKFNNKFVTFNEKNNWVMSNKKSEFNKYFEKRLLKAREHDKVCLVVSAPTLKSRRYLINIFQLFKIHIITLLCTNELIKERRLNRIGNLINDKELFEYDKSFIMPVLAEGFTKHSIVLNYKG